MNLMFDAMPLIPRFTGFNEYCTRLGLHLQNFQKEDDSICYYTRTIDYLKRYYGSGHNISYYRKSIFFNKLRPYKKGIDVWHTTNQASKYMPNFKDIKQVVTFHDLNFLHDNPNIEQTKSALKVHQECLDKADHIVAISEFAKNDILNNLDIKDKPITVIYNGCTISEYPNFNTPKYRTQKPFLFSLGVIMPKKNFHVLPCLLQNNDFELLIAGNNKNPDYANRIMEEAKRFGVESRVKILGPVSAEEKYWYMKNCKAFVFPSIAEGFGIPAIEAMSLGKPTFLSTLTSLPEIGGQYAYYFSSFNPEVMQNTLTIGLDHFYKENPKDLIIQNAKKYNWDQAAEEYWKVYKSLI